MRLTVVPIDGIVCKNGECFNDIDLSWVPDEVHAVQWYDDHGEVELKTPDPNIPITDLGIYLQASDLWDAKKEEFIQAELNRDYWEEFRTIRNYKLLQSDWTQLPDVSLTVEEKAAWDLYRQQLRALPDNITDPKPLVLDFNHPDWPVPPA
jgi:hypothetical protein